MRNRVDLIKFYADEICKKIDLKANYFIQRFEALRTGDLERAKEVEKRYLEPLSKEIYKLVSAALRDLYGQ